MPRAPCCLWLHPHGAPSSIVPPGPQCPHPSPSPSPWYPEPLDVPVPIPMVPPSPSLWCPQPHYYGAPSPTVPPDPLAPPGLSSVAPGRTDSRARGGSLLLRLLPSSLRLKKTNTNRQTDRQRRPGRAGGGRPPIIRLVPDTREVQVAENFKFTIRHFKAMTGAKPLVPITPPGTPWQGTDAQGAGQRWRAAAEGPGGEYITSSFLNIDKLLF